LLFGTCFQSKSDHEVKDLFADNSAPKCRSAGAFLSTCEVSSRSNGTLRPDDISLGGVAAAQPGSAVMRSLDFFAEGAKPRTAGISDNHRVRIHGVNVKVHGETGVLIRGAK
jgi:hypothetical protein